MIPNAGAFKLEYRRKLGAAFEKDYWSYSLTVNLWWFVLYIDFPRNLRKK